jgi:hypothetical protein
MSPMMATLSPSNVPYFSRSVIMSSNAWVDVHACRRRR